MAKTRKKATDEPLPADEAAARYVQPVDELPLAAEETRECDVDKAFVESLAGEVKSFARRACEALSGRADELEGRAAALEDRLTEYDRGGAKYPKDTRTYVVKKGDTMAKIAKELLSNAGLFGKIAMWNYDSYPSLRTNSDKVDEGWELRIPPE